MISNLLRGADGTVDPHHVTLALGLRCPVCRRGFRPLQEFALIPVAPFDAEAAEKARRGEPFRVRVDHAHWGCVLGAYLRAAIWARHPRDARGAWVGPASA